MYKIIYQGIEITIFKDICDVREWNVFFDGTGAACENFFLGGCYSKSEAFAAGKKFVDNRQWEHPESYEALKFYIWLWYDGKRIRSVK